MRTETGRIKTLNFLLMLQHGTIMILWGSVIPEVIDAFSLSEASAGILLGLGTMGAFFGPLLAGPSIDRVGLKLVMLLGFAGEVIFLLMFGAAQWFWMLVLASFIVHICSGFIETAGNVLPNRVNLPNIGSFMSLVHFAFSLGAFIAPFLVGWYIDATGLWRPVPGLIAVPALLLGLLTLRARVDGGGALTAAASEVSAADDATTLPAGRPPGSPSGSPSGSPLLFLKTLRKRPVVGGALTLFLYVGSEVGLSSWVVYYLRTSLAFPPFRAASGLSILWMGLMIGRFANTFLSKHFSSLT
ncbi:MAG: MFS transporter, partial [Sediminispirochaetaceae bacterium]